MHQFATSGFQIFKDGVSKSDIGMLLKVLRAGLAGKDGASPGTDKMGLLQLIAMRESQDHSQVYRSQISVGSSFAAYNVIAKSGFLQIAAEVTGAKVENLHAMPLHISIQNPLDESYDYKWHQESTFYPWCPDILNFWFPLVERSSVAAGTMSAIPGSHLHGVRPFDTYFNEKNFRQIETRVSPDEVMTEVPFEFDVGDLAVFDSNLVHRSLINTSDNPRLTGILRVVNMETQKEFRPLYKALTYEV